MKSERTELYFLILPAILIALSLFSLGFWHLRLGIDLSSGSLLEVTYATSRPAPEAIQQAVADLGLGSVRVQPTGENGYFLRARPLSGEETAALETRLQTLGSLHVDQSTSIGPTIGAELLQKGLLALGLVIVLIILFIAFAFRKVSKPVASWKYGIITIVTLVHDILVPAGLFALLGRLYGAEVDSLFIVGLLTVLGISINDTIVVFDRIRENLQRNEDTRLREPFSDTLWRSIKQTIARSINTSLTVVVVLVALFAWGPVSTKDFALTLIVGMVAGTYSSIFLASPLLVVWERWSASSSLAREGQRRKA
jgi:preprotein translocase subunit SecF